FFVPAFLSLSTLAFGGGAVAASIDSLVIPGLGPPLTAQPTPPPQSGLGGGFVEFLLTGRSAGARPAPQPYSAEPQAIAALTPPAPGDVEAKPADEFLRQEVDYSGSERPGTIVIDTPNKFL